MVCWRTYSRFNFRFWSLGSFFSSNFYWFQNDLRVHQKEIQYNRQLAQHQSIANLIYRYQHWRFSRWSQPFSSEGFNHNSCNRNWSCYVFAVFFRRLSWRQIWTPSKKQSWIIRWSNFSSYRTENTPWTPWNYLVFPTPSVHKYQITPNYSPKKRSLNLLIP